MFLFLMYQSPIADTEAYLLLPGLRLDCAAVRPGRSDERK